ncbi:MAG: tetratricopeptide repeat protein [Bryobacteraceae bacterium]|nr:tetratricopeptide repeat protein [Bryobacteraceae bacterium]MCX7602584.1 tetratricopeptide repeat protein [Bryobacteraceae bacterium]
MMDMGRLEQLQQLVEQDPANSRFRYMLGMELLGMGRAAEAAETLRALLERDPDYVPAWYQAGRAFEQAGDPESARACYRLGIEAARRAGDMHAASELQAALDLLG